MIYFNVDVPVTDDLIQNVMKHNYLDSEELIYVLAALQEKPTYKIQFMLNPESGSLDMMPLSIDDKSIVHNKIVKLVAMKYESEFEPTPST